MQSFKIYVKKHKNIFEVLGFKKNRKSLTIFLVHLVIYDYNESLNISEDKMDDEDIQYVKRKKVIFFYQCAVRL